MYTSGYGEGSSVSPRTYVRTNSVNLTQKHKLALRRQVGVADESNNRGLFTQGTDVRVPIVSLKRVFSNPTHDFFPKPVSFLSVKMYFF